MNPARQRHLLFILICLSFLTPYFVPNSLLSQSTEGQNSWLQVEIGIIGTASSDILSSAMTQVKKNQNAGLIIKLDTPGGALDATRKMVKQIMNAPFPVIVWVGPNGSRAGSAGAFITLSAHVAAMATGTNIGAAHPVNASGKDVKDKHMAAKIENDTIAFIESIAENRGRNIEMARSFVKTSASITAKEALEHKVIDLIADNIPALLKKIDGKKINLDNGNEVTLSTANAALLDYEKSLKERFLEILSNPNLFYLLFVGGLIGLGFELTHPGSLFPGVAGGICMILALIATSVLPVSFGAMLLVLAGIAFIIAEMFIPSFGILGIGGFVAFVIGSFLLVDPGNEQGLRISWTTIAPGALAIALTSLFIGYLVLKSDRSKVQSGSEALINGTGIAIASFSDGRGHIRIEGEEWLASLDSPGDAAVVQKGDALKVCRRDGLTLYVKKV